MRLENEKERNKKNKYNDIILLRDLPPKEKKEAYDLIKEMGIKVGKKLDFLPDKVGSEVRITNGDILHLPAIILYDEVM